VSREIVTFTVGPQNYIVEDKPRISGTASNVGVALTPANVQFVTLRSVDNTGVDFLEERASVVDTAGAFSVNYPTEIGNYSFGFLYLRAYWVDGSTITLDGPLSDSATTASFTVTSGQLESDGYILIDDEIIEYTKTSDTTADLSRAQFGTVAAAHLDAATCGFASNWQNAINSFKVTVETDSRELSQFSYAQVYPLPPGVR